MTAAEAYEKYKHMDAVLSDPQIVESNDFIRAICCVLWQAVKIEAAKGNTP